MGEMRDAEFVQIAKALADATRHRMLLELRAAGELTCSQICEKFPQSQPTISHHIKTLAEAGLVSCRKEGQFHVISVNEEVVAAFAQDITPEPTASKRKAVAERG